MKIRPFLIALHFGLVFTIGCALPVDSIGQPPGRAGVGGVHPFAQSLHDEGELNSSNVLHLTLIHKLSAVQQQNLDRLLADQQTPGSANYHQWLTSEDFGMRFGFSQQENFEVSAWLRVNGMRNLSISKSRASISFNAPVATVEIALRTKIHRFSFDGSVHYANTSQPSLPLPLAKSISDIHGVNDFNLKRKPVPLYAYSGSPLKWLTPNDLAAIYDIQSLYNSGINGDGVTIGIIGTGDLDPNVVRAYRSQFNLPAREVQIEIVPGTSPSQDMGSQVEGYLDVEIAGAVARNANIVYVRSNSADSALQYAIENNVASILSYSFAGCEQPGIMRSFYEPLLKQANSQGITVLAGAGDWGAAGCESSAAGSPAVNGLSVMVPASSPQVTAVGGTMFTDSTSTQYWDPSSGVAVSYIPETAWNEGSYATGGGKSDEYAKPAWQAGPGVPADGERDVPDVAMAAGLANPYLVCVTLNCAGEPQAGGGTSASTPVFAGIVALLNQNEIKDGTLSLPGLGNINPQLYLLAVKGPGAFHDITSGNNSVRCQIGKPDCPTGTMGYTAGKGYDQATGLGSVDAQQLVSLWSSAAPIASTVIFPPRQIRQSHLMRWPSPQM